MKGVHQQLYTVILLILSLLLYGCQTTSSVNKTRTLAEQEAQGLIHTGLQPLYPSQAHCLEVASFFADRTRYDGSLRTVSSNNGYHGGIDISVPSGTPIVAIAAGTVVQVARGGQLVGNKITLQHAPADTGWPLWTYSKYQHLAELPDLAPGQRVKMGQVIALSGKTGTAGKHYGKAGYPHLHMNVYSSDSSHFMIKGHKLIPDHMRYVDPLAFYLGKELDSNTLRLLTPEDKTFAVPFMDTSGNITPPDTKVVWPFLCTPS
ncbi:MAG: M23 family metallopeptidase [Proteobacteria bacterium]|nr:M23 family metallopeptidase [Pseudomonadota bacterium]MBU1640375.1 M23 family metallopeptidase [Pseudomonadota bacterium]